uniref:AAA+ ATPase domain-containing protein n=1 Tax=Panagrolaimus davidi TaxID=227884 RepID=A0A914RCZ6_9BILA
MGEPKDIVKNIASGISIKVKELVETLIDIVQDDVLTLSQEDEAIGNLLSNALRNHPQQLLRDLDCLLNDLLSSLNLNEILNANGLLKLDGLLKDGLLGSLLGENGVVNRLLLDNGGMVGGVLASQEKRKSFNQTLVLALKRCPLNAGILGFVGDLIILVRTLFEKIIQILQQLLPSLSTKQLDELTALLKNENMTKSKILQTIVNWNEAEPLDDEILRMTADDIKSRTQLLDNEIRIMINDVQRIDHSVQSMKEKIKENNERIKVNKTLPYLISNVVELLELEELQEKEGANVDLDAHKTQCAVIKTSTKATYFLPVVGLVDPKELKPGDLDSFLVLEKLPAEYDSRVKAMEVDERPNVQYIDIGGYDKQIQELIEAIVLPMTHKDRFINLGIHPPKGVLMYGPPGTGKTMLARAVAAQTESTFLKLAGPQLVQTDIGDGAKLVRDIFALAKEKAPAIIFIDELDAIGTKRFDSEKAGDREIQRTMLELLNQLDGFQPNDDIKVIAATNRVDVLDPALLRSGRLDRKIELPVPTEDARRRIMQIHSRKMNVFKNVNFDELARCTDNFNGAQCKAVCVEAGMIALRYDATVVTHEDFMDAILEVQAKKKTSLNYYA